MREAHHRLGLGGDEVGEQPRREHVRRLLALPLDALLPARVEVLARAEAAEGALQLLRCDELVRRPVDGRALVLLEVERLARLPVERAPQLAVGQQLADL